jgi:hypothetical protein
VPNTSLIREHNYFQRFSFSPKRVFRCPLRSLVDICYYVPLPPFFLLRR